jgi:hypothetical protein
MEREHSFAWAQNPVSHAETIGRLLSSNMSNCLTCIFKFPYLQLQAVKELTACFFQYSSTDQNDAMLIIF